MTIIALASFERAAKKAGLSQSERDALILLLEQFPASGDLIPGAGGARKVRLAREGGGKSGGYRVITYFGGGEMPVHLLDVYAKNVKTDLSSDEKKQVKALSKELLKIHKGRKP
jgi:hypothetical protein